MDYIVHEVAKVGHDWVTFISLHLTSVENYAMQACIDCYIFLYFYFYADLILDLQVLCSAGYSLKKMLLTLNFYVHIYIVKKET